MQASKDEANLHVTRCDEFAPLFLQFAIEAGTGNEDAADYLLTVMDDALYEAVLWWSDVPDDDRPATPFTDDNPYVADLFSEELLSEGDALMDEADELRLTAEEAEATSDRYNLANVFFAVVLFIAFIRAFTHWHMSRAPSEINRKNMLFFSLLESFRAQMSKFPTA